MHALAQLWLPILLSAVFVFVASALIHMVFKWHNSDYRKLANEDAVRAAINAGTAGPGEYVLPYCKDGKEMQAEDNQRKFREGPVALLTVRPNGVPNMGATLLQWFVLTLVVAAVAGGTAGAILGTDGNARIGGHLVGMMTLLAYATGSVVSGIWMGKPWRSVAKDLLDSLIYATISALTFMWLWP